MVGGLGHEQERGELMRPHGRNLLRVSHLWAATHARANKAAGVGCNQSNQSFCNRHKRMEQQTGPAENVDEHEGPLCQGM